ncbi:hypothetical protein EJC47_20645 [Sphingomonas sp. TF3]|uniref:CopD family protein n=1 Tax=Sphingomonas sp. TF3 TaxID=2495580 RepID=UPI000F877858|nr:CopD family protein [Sphingomonas sp. TF3]RUN74617.1 hypothetical protein EJC47_20645 [Sphingomonas sp. TF3]
MMQDLYPWLKALHVASAMIFISGVLAVGAFLGAARPDDALAAKAMRRWDQHVTMPAMLLVWSFGLSLGLAGGWFRDGWLIAKLVFVVVLSGIHGAQSGRLRRMAGGLPVAHSARLTLPLVLGSVTAIAILAVVKPS